MARRRRMSRRVSKKVFKKHYYKWNRRNFVTKAPRGGIRF